VGAGVGTLPGCPAAGAGQVLAGAGPRGPMRHPRPRGTARAISTGAGARACRAVLAPANGGVGGNERGEPGSNPVRAPGRVRRA